MDWRSLMDDDNWVKRRVAEMNQPSAAIATAPEEDGGFFGNIASKVTAPVKAVGGFFGNMITDAIDKGEEAIGGIVNIAQGEGRRQELEKATAESDQNRREWKAYMDTLGDGDYNKPEVKKKLEAYKQKFHESQTKAREITDSKEWKQAQEIDPAKLAASAGETALNIAGGASLAKAVGKGVVKQGAKVLGKEVLQETAEQTAKKTAAATAAAAANRTAGGAAKTIAANAGEGALFGAAYGAIQPLSNEGSNAKLDDVWMNALFGGATGGVLGGASTLLDKNVRAGTRQIPGAIREGAQELGESVRSLTPAAIAESHPAILELNDTIGRLNGQRAQLVANGLSENSAPVRANAAAVREALEERSRVASSISEGGYISPGGGIPEANPSIADSAEIARRQLMGEPATPPPTNAAIPELLTPEQRTQVQTQGATPIPSTTQPPVAGLLPERAGAVGDQLPLLDVPAQPKFDAPEAIQTRLAEMEARTNPNIDVVDTTGLPTPAAVPEVIPPTALPEGVTPPSPAAAKRQIAQGKEVPETLNKLRDGRKPIELAASADDMSDVAMRRTAGGELKPYGTNPGARIKQSTVDAIAGVLKSAASSGKKIKIARTESINQAIARLAGKDENSARIMYDSIVKPIQEANLGASQKKIEYLQRIKNLVGDTIKNRDTDRALAQFIETKNPNTEAAILKDVAKKYGQDVADKFSLIKPEYMKMTDEILELHNQRVIPAVGQDKALVHLTDESKNYVPRMEKSPGVFRMVKDKIQGKGQDFTGRSTNAMTGEIGSTEGSISAASMRTADQGFLGSEYAKPNSPFLSSRKARTAADRSATQLGAIEALEKYVDSTVEAAYRTPVIAQQRSLVNALSDMNVKEGGGLERIIRDLDEHTNIYAGKTHPFDRWLKDSDWGNITVRAMNKLMSNTSTSTILGSVNSAMVQAAQLPYVYAEVGEKSLMKGLADQMTFIGKEIPADDITKFSKWLPGRYPEKVDRALMTALDRGTDKAKKVTSYVFNQVEENSVKGSWRAMAEKVAKDNPSFSKQQIADDVDRRLSNIIGDRSPGMRASIFESQTLTPALAFQLEVNAAFQAAKQQIKDPVKAARLIAGLTVMGMGYQAATGNNPVADPVGATRDAAETLFGDNDKSVAERAVGAVGRLGGEVIEQIPGGAAAASFVVPEQGMKVPFTGGDRVLSRSDVFGGSDIGRYGGSLPIQSLQSNPLNALGIPGMGQLVRGAEGYQAYNQGESISPAGRSRFTIDQDMENFIRSILFGQYQTREGRQYIEDLTRRAQGYSTATR